MQNQADWQKEADFRLGLMRLAAAVDRRTPEQIEQAEALAELVRKRPATEN